MEEREGLQGPRSPAISVTQNTSAASHREGQILGVGLECKGPGGGGVGGAAISPLLASWRAPIMPFGEGRGAHSKVHGVRSHWALVVMVMI